MDGEDRWACGRVKHENGRQRRSAAISSAVFPSDGPRQPPPAKTLSSAGSPRRFRRVYHHPLDHQKLVATRHSDDHGGHSSIRPSTAPRGAFSPPRRPPLSVSSTPTSPSSLPSNTLLTPLSLSPRSARFASTDAVADPKAKANSLIDALPGNSIVSKTGWVTLGTALTGAAISNEVYVLNEETVIFAGFITFVTLLGSYIRKPYTEWADAHIAVRNPPFAISAFSLPKRNAKTAGVCAQKTTEILNASRVEHTDAVKSRIEAVGEMKDVVDITKQLFAMSKVSHLPLPSAAPLPFPFSRHLSGAGLADARLARQETANLEHEAYTLRQRSAVRDEIKNVLDAHVRHEAQQRELEQQELVKTVMENVRKQLGDGKFQKDVLADAVASLESASCPPPLANFSRYADVRFWPHSPRQGEEDLSTRLSVSKVEKHHPSRAGRGIETLWSIVSPLFRQTCNLPLHFAVPSLAPLVLSCPFDSRAFALR